MAAATQTHSQLENSQPLTMKALLFALNAAFLFLCVSMYLGTGWSLVLFSFPVAPRLTVDNYYLVFVPEVAAATAFFTGMTKAMIVSCGIMIWAEWKTHYRWVPIIVLLAVIAATVLTEHWIFPLNAEMANGIKDQAELQRVLSSWISTNKIRVGFWTLQWAAMMTYCALKSRQPQGGLP
jgi:hypothetical protein